MRKTISPYIIIILSFLGVILIGSLLLLLPFSLKSGVNISYLDALFTSTSSVTITGMMTINIQETFTIFGYFIIALLMILGGLSITTLTFFVLTLIGTKLGFGTRELLRETANFNSRTGIVRFVKKVVILSLVIEIFAGLVFMIIFLRNGMDFDNALGRGLFHAISSYNNAGIDILGSNSLLNFQNNYLFNILTILLIILGGIGAVVIFDVIEKRRWRKLTFHSKIVLKMTLLLLLFGAITFYLMEKDVTILQSIMHSATLRTAGFYSYDYTKVSYATILIMMVLMYIGAAPGSNGGGIKVTTAYTVVKASIGFTKQKEVLSYQRRIPNRYRLKAFAVVFYSLFLLFLSTILISLFDKNIELTIIFFEIISAFSSTGLTLGLTPNLSNYSQIILMILMFIGRVGVLTFFNVIFKHEEHVSKDIQYIDLEYII